MIKKFWFKSCPKCHGDLVLEQDRWGSYRICIQCGYSQEMPAMTKVLPEPVPARREQKVA